MATHHCYVTRRPAPTIIASGAELLEESHPQPLHFCDCEQAAPVRGDTDPVEDLTEVVGRRRVASVSKAT
jgi:hypothetical protein